jgi:hypothetical protein
VKSDLIDGGDGVFWLVFENRSGHAGGHSWQYSPSAPGSGAESWGSSSGTRVMECAETLE